MRKMNVLSWRKKYYECQIHRELRLQQVLNRAINPWLAGQLHLTTSAAFDKVAAILLRTQTVRFFFNPPLGDT